MKFLRNMIRKAFTDELNNYCDKIVRPVFEEAAEQKMDALISETLYGLKGQSYRLEYKLEQFVEKIIAEREVKFLKKEDVIDSLIERINKKQLNK